MAGSWVAHQVNSRAFASTSCTDGSNVSPSATQSEVQRNPPGLLLKLREMGAIPHLLRSNRTGESVLLIAAGKLCSLFLRRASEQSGFNNSVRRMQCDHKPIMRRKQLDFVSTGGARTEESKGRSCINKQLQV